MSARARNPLWHVLLLLCIWYSPVSAQTPATDAKKDFHTAQNSFFLEVGGSGLWYSINYERFVFTGQSLRMGLGYYERIGLPVLYNVLLGSGTHQLEIGLGGTFLLPVKQRDQLKAYAAGNLSYRWLFSTETGINFFRISFTPLVDNLSARPSEISFIPWGGVSFGIQY